MEPISIQECITELTDKVPFPFTFAKDTENGGRFVVNSITEVGRNGQGTFTITQEGGRNFINLSGRFDFDFFLSLIRAEQ